MNLKYLRSFRIYNIAMFDVIVSIIGLIIICLISRDRYWPRKDWKPFVGIAIFYAIPIGIVTHIIFGVNTQLNYKLGLSDKPTA